VALKIEKKDKNKTILYFEFNVLNVLKGKIINDYNEIVRTEACVQRV
jgi:hypothetical protein